MSEVTVILPAYNESKSIESVIDEIRGLSIACEILVGDNGSTDSTALEVINKGISPIYVGTKGKGYVIQELLLHVTTPYAIMVDADFTYSLESIPEIVNLLKSDVDVVIGWRKFKAQNSMSMLNKLGNFGLTKIANILYGTDIHDLCTGLWGFRMDTINKFVIVSNSFTLEANLFVNAIKMGSIIKEITIKYRARMNNSHTKLKMIDGFKIAWFLIQHRFKHNSIKEQRCKKIME